MLEAAIGAGTAAFGLVVGYIIADRYRPNDDLVGKIMGLGAGVLMAVVAYASLESVEGAERPALLA